MYQHLQPYQLCVTTSFPQQPLLLLSVLSEGITRLRFSPVLESSCAFWGPASLPLHHLIVIFWRAALHHVSAAGHNLLKQARLHRGSSPVIFALAGVTMVMRAAEKPFFNVGNTQVHTAVWGAGVILESELCLMEQRMF